MRAQHLNKVLLTYVSTVDEVAKLLESLGAVPGTAPGVKYEIDVSKNPRNRPGYRVSLMGDITSLRSMGCVLEYVFTPDALLAAKRGIIVLPGVLPDVTPGPKSLTSDERQGKASHKDDK